MHQIAFHYYCLQLKAADTLDKVSLSRVTSTVTILWNLGVHAEWPPIACFKLSSGKELREISETIDRANRWQENKDLREVKENQKYMGTLVGKRRKKGKAIVRAYLESWLESSAPVPPPLF